MVFSQQKRYCRARRRGEGALADPVRARPTVAVRARGTRDATLGGGRHQHTTKYVLTTALPLECLASHSTYVRTRNDAIVGV